MLDVVTTEKKSVRKISKRTKRYGVTLASWTSKAMIVYEAHFDKGALSFAANSLQMVIC